MTTTFEDFYRQVWQEALDEGPEAVAELIALRDRYRIARDAWQAASDYSRSLAEVERLVGKP